MDGFILLVALAVLGIPLVRYFVWSTRYSQIKSSLDLLRAAQERLSDRLNDVEKKIELRGFALPKAAKAPAKALHRPPKPALVEELEPAQQSPVPEEELAQQVRSSAAWTGPMEPEAAKASKVEAAVAEPAGKHWVQIGSVDSSKPEAAVSEPAGRKPSVAGRVATAARGAMQRASEKVRETLGGKTTDWETLIGGRWLNLIGMVVLVIGIVLLTQQAVQYMTAAQKIGAGVVFSVALIIGGILMERLTAYQRIGRTLIGGGWALLYFDAFAAHQLPQAKIIDDPVIGLAALAMVAGGMIAHSLRYRSQLVTGLAYGLGFMAIVLTDPTLMSLVASALLAASLVVVTRFLSWHYLAVAGVLGTYLNHWNWLRTVNKALAAAADTSSPMSGITPDKGFWLSSTILAFYWALFALVSLNRSITSARDRNIHMGINVANTIGMLGLMMLQINQQYAGDYLFSLTGPSAVAYAAIAYLDRRFSQRVLFLFNTTVGLGLYCATLPLAIEHYGWNPGWLAPYLMAGALMVMAVGFRLREPLLRLEAYGLSLATLGAALFINLRQPGAELINALWFAVPVLIVVFQVLSEWLRKRQADKSEPQENATVALAYGIGATLMLANLVWVQFPHDMVGITWLAVGVMLFEIGARKANFNLRIQSYLLLVFAIAALMVVNFGYGQITPADASAPRWMIVIAAIAFYYYLYWRQISGTWQRGLIERGFGSLPSFAATLLVIVLAYRELNHGALTAAWTLWGIVLIEAGLLVRERLVRLQGYGLMALAFVCAVGINIYGLDPLAPDTGITNWLMAAVNVAGLVYVFVRFALGKPSVIVTEGLVSDLASTAAMLLTALILWHELPSLGVAVAWCLLGLVLFELSVYIKTPVMRAQAHALMIAAFARLFLANFVIDGDVNGLSFRLITVVPVIMTVYYLRQRVIEVLAAPITVTTIGQKLLHLEPRIGETLYSYAGAILIVVLCRFEFGRAHAVAAWAPLVLGFLFLGRKFDNRDFRFQSYLLAIYSFFRAWSTNIYLDGHWLGLPERLSTTLPMVVALSAAAVLCLRQAGGSGDTAATGIVGRLNYLDGRARTLYSLLAAGFIAVLLYYQLDTFGFVAAGWAIEGLALVGLGMWLHCRDFKVEGYVLALAAFVLAMRFGVQEAERLMTVVPVVAVLFAIALTCARHVPVKEQVKSNRLDLLESYSRMLFSLSASLLLAVLLYFYLSIDRVSIGWAIEGFALMVLGFALNDRNFRIHGLILLFVCLLKVTFIDLAGAETIYRTLSFIVLGLILLLASLAYTRYRNVIGRYI